MINLFKSSWGIIWRIILFLLVWGILYTPFIFTVSEQLKQLESIQSLPLQLYVETSGIVTILVAAWGMLHFIDRRPFLSLGFRLRNAVQDSLLGLGIGAGMMFLSVSLLGLEGWVRVQQRGNFSGLALSSAGVALLLNTVTQEVLVRGYILQTIRLRAGAILALILSSVIFALLHVSAAQGAPLAIFNLFIAGLLLGYAYITTLNLWMPIGIHFVWNFIQGPVLGLVVSGKPLDSGWRLLTLQGPALFTGGDFGLEGGLVATVTTLAGLFVLYFYRGKQNSLRRRME